MPHTNRKTTPVPGVFKPAVFVNINLTDDQRQAIKGIEIQTERLDDTLRQLLDGGYKITLRFDDRNDCFAAWLIAPLSGQNKGMILPGRGSTPLKAIRQLSYIHFVALEGDWGTIQDQPSAALDD